MSAFAPKADVRQSAYLVRFQDTQILSLFKSGLLVKAALTTMLQNMGIDYTKLIPDPSETKEEYCQRLEDDGHEEMLIRKALACHYKMKVSEMGAFFKHYELARLRHIQMLTEIAPNRTDYSLMKKVGKNLGLTDKEASCLIKRFRSTDPDQLKYIL